MTIQFPIRSEHELGRALRDALLDDEISSDFRYDQIDVIRTWVNTLEDRVADRDRVWRESHSRMLECLQALDRAFTKAWRDKNIAASVISKELLDEYRDAIREAEALLAEQETTR